MTRDLLSLGVLHGQLERNSTVFYLTAVTVVAAHFCDSLLSMIADTLTMPDQIRFIVWVLEAVAAAVNNCGYTMLNITMYIVEWALDYSTMYQQTIADFIFNYWSLGDTIVNVLISSTFLQIMQSMAEGVHPEVRKWRLFTALCLVVESALLVVLNSAALVADNPLAAGTSAVWLGEVAFLSSHCELVLSLTHGMPPAIGPLPWSTNAFLFAVSMSRDLLSLCVLRRQLERNATLFTYMTIVVVFAHFCDSTLSMVAFGVDMPDWVRFILWSLETAAANTNNSGYTLLNVTMYGRSAGFLYGSHSGRCSILDLLDNIWFITVWALDYSAMSHSAQLLDWSLFDTLLNVLISSTFLQIMQTMAEKVHPEVRKWRLLTALCLVVESVTLVVLNSLALVADNPFTNVTSAVWLGESIRLAMFSNYLNRLQRILGKHGALTKKPVTAKSQHKSANRHPARPEGVSTDTFDSIDLRNEEKI
ncbi:hypothetical protein RI367_001053 [Sorochytrium milnesiophthora]